MIGRLVSHFGRAEEYLIFGQLQVWKSKSRAIGDFLRVGSSPTLVNLILITLFFGVRMVNDPSIS